MNHPTQTFAQTFRYLNVYGLILHFNRPLLRIKRQFLIIDGQISNCLTNKFSRIGFACLEFCSSNLIFVDSQILIFNPGEGGDSKVAVSMYGLIAKIIVEACIDFS